MLHGRYAVLMAKKSYYKDLLVERGQCSWWAMVLVVSVVVMSAWAVFG